MVTDNFLTIYYMSDSLSRYDSYDRETLKSILDNTKRELRENSYYQGRDKGAKKAKYIEAILDRSSPKVDKRDNLGQYDSYTEDRLRDVLANTNRLLKENNYREYDNKERDRRKSKYITLLLKAAGETNVGWPEIWSPGGLVPKFSHLTGNTDPYTMLGVTYHNTKYQKFGHLGQELHDFSVFVANGKSFMSNLPRVTERWSTGKTIGTNVYDLREEDMDYTKDPYYAMLCGMYIASFLSGVSMLNIHDTNTPDVIKSIARFHLYYQTRKFITNPELIKKFDVSGVRPMIPYRHKDYELTETNTTVAKHPEFKRYPVLDGTKIKATIELTKQDYYGMIAYRSGGITRIGLELLQESCEAYVYAVLGAQAKTRWTIVDNGGRSLQTQTAFRKIVEDTILQSDTTVTLSNMRRAVDDCNVTLNMAITPGVILIPSNMIILKTKIPGYNNTLTLVKDGMTFGTNEKLNYVGTKKYVPKTENHPPTVTHKLPGDKYVPPPKQKPKVTLDNDEHKQSLPPIVRDTAPNDDNTEMIVLAGLVLVGTALVLSKVWK